MYKVAKSYLIARGLAGAGIGGAYGATTGALMAGVGGNPKTRKGRIAHGAYAGGLTGAIGGAVSGVAPRLMPASAVAGIAPVIGGVQGRSMGYTWQKPVERMLDKVGSDAFLDEMVNIKLAEEDARMSASDVGKALKNLGLGALAYSAGSLTAGYGSKKLFPKILGPSAPASRANLLGKGLGILSAAGTLALADALATNARMIRDSNERDK